MTKIRIENLGPIVDSGTIELTPFTLLMGPQSSGKSSFLKVLCFCRWIEKRIMVSTSDLVNQYTHYGRFLKELKQFHRLSDEFFSKNTRITYESDLLTIAYAGEKNPKIQKKRNFQAERYNTKLSYIPAERNLVAAIKNIDKAYRSSERDVLFNLIYEWDEARSHYTKDNPYPLSVTGAFRYYNRNGEDSFLMENGESFPAFYASSGLQSVMPLEVMSRYFLSLAGTRAEFSMHDYSAYIMEVLKAEGNTKAVNFIDEKSIEALRRRLNYQSAQLFIEEPEQNLYPESQRLLLLSLVKALKQAQEAGPQMSSIVMTTHSPYVLSVVNVLFRASAYYGDSHNAAVFDVIDSNLLLPKGSYSAYFISDGRFTDVLDADVPMFSGNELDGVSDWVDEKIARLNDLIYDEEEN